VTGWVLLLVATAALGHASWNLLTKRSADKLVFLWWTGLIGSVVFLPIVLWRTPGWRWPPGTWGGVALAMGLRAVYFASLGAAYARGDLSLVYPLARGLAPVLVLPLAMLLLSERPSARGVAGVVTVAAGCYVLHLPELSRAYLTRPLRALASASHVRYAALTGLLIAAYSLTDAWNVRRGVPPLAYAYLTVPLAALLLTPAVLRRGGVAAEWRRGPGAVVAVAVLMTAGYLLVLLAFRQAPVSYVAPARELGIVFGALLGSAWLGEGHVRPRAVGSGLIVGGVLLLTG
jgi:drug/metabolite transporter (DMT)-like permease